MLTEKQLNKKIYNRAQQFCVDTSALVETAPRNYAVKIPVMMRNSLDPVYITGSGTSLTKAVLRLNSMIDSLKGVQDFRTKGQRNFWRSFYGMLHNQENENN